MEEEATRPVPDGVRARFVVVVAVAFVVVTACGVWVAWTIAESPQADDRGGRWGAPSPDMQAIEMSLLPRSDALGAHVGAPADASSEPVRSARDAREHLSSYGYSDRSRGTVHIPLARAKQLFLERERARSAGRALPAGRAR
jgi:hypothetical protein